MKEKSVKTVRTTVICFIASLILLSILLANYMLTVFAVMTGFAFIVLARTQRDIFIDEREQTIQEKAAQMAYAIFTPTIGIGAIILLIPSYSGISVFSKGEFTYLESLGVVLIYLTLFLIALYSLSYYFLHKRYGGGK